jgi:hypothetical protein
MSIPSNTNFDDIEGSDEIDLNSLDPVNDVSHDNDISSSEFLIYDSIARDVENRHEISILFEKFNDLDVRSDYHKIIMSNLYVFVCAMACNIVRKSGKGDQRAIFGESATYFNQVMTAFPTMTCARNKFWIHVPASFFSTWPKSFIDFVNAEKAMDVQPTFAKKYRAVSEEGPGALRHVFFGSKVWETATEARSYVTNKCNRLYIAPRFLASGLHVLYDIERFLTFTNY